MKPHKGKEKEKQKAKSTNPMNASRLNAEDYDSVENPKTFLSSSKKVKKPRSCLQV
jgi:ribosomal protein S18